MRIKSVLIKNTILVICHRKKLFQAWTDALSLSELVLFHSLKWQLSITTKYKCFILERALVERLKAILRKLLSLFERGVWVRASCFALGRLHVYKDVRSFQCTYYAQSRPQSSWGQHKKCRLLQSRVSSMYRGAHFSALGLARARDHVADQKKKKKDWVRERGRRKWKEMFRALSFGAPHVFSSQYWAFKSPFSIPLNIQGRLAQREVSWLSKESSLKKW